MQDHPLARAPRWHQSLLPKLRQPGLHFLKLGPQQIDFHSRASHKRTMCVCVSLEIGQQNYHVPSHLLFQATPKAPNKTGVPATESDSRRRNINVSHPCGQAPGWHPKSKSPPPIFQTGNPPGVVTCSAQANSGFRPSIT